MLRVRDNFKLRDRAEEKRAFHNPSLNFLRSVKGQCLRKHSGKRVHAVKEEERGREQTDFHRDCQIENNGQEEGQQQSGFIGKRKLSESNKFVPVAHIKAMKSRIADSEHSGTFIARGAATRIMISSVRL